MIAIQLYSGFLQPEQISNGMGSLRNRLVTKLEKVEHYLNYSRWIDPLAERAKQIRLYCDIHPGTKIYLIGHSFGGATAVMLAEELKPLQIECLYLADAVHHSGCGGSLVGKLPHKRTIEIPDNVKFLSSWRQTTNLPRGSKLKIKYPTIWRTNAFVDVKHSRMDELPAIEAEVMREVYREI